MFKIGDDVVIIDGPLSGIRGVVDDSSNRNGIIVALDILQQRVHVQVSSNSLRLSRRPIPKPVIDSLAEVSRDLISRLSSNPSDMQKLHPRKFEELICELLIDLGYSAKLTPFSKDGGRDILAILHTPLGDSLTIVECKRYSMHRKIGVDLVQRFLWVAQENRANSAMIATTSKFTSGAKEIEREYSWTLKLNDLENISQWLNGYGKWGSSPFGGLWLPKNDALNQANGALLDS